MKTQIQVRTNSLFCTAALGLSALLGGLSPQANALQDGAAPRLTGLKIYTPAGDAVEMSTNDESLSSVALEVNIEADKLGVEYFELSFRSPDKTKVATYWGSGNWSTTTSNPLLARVETNLTFVLGAGDLSKFYDARGSVRPLDDPGTWTLDSAYLYGKNGKSTFLSASNGDLPAGLTNNSFRVTRWFNSQPGFTSVLGGGTLTLAPEISPAAVASPSYQWFRNGTAISGATKIDYSKTNVTAADAGLYYVQVTSGSAKVRSDAVPVSIRSADVVAARSEINLQNAAQAKQRAAAALKVSPDSGEALFVSALSELLGVLTDPLTKPLLVDMGASVTPKVPFSDFNWTGTFPATANSAKFNAWLLSVFLPAVERADTALEKITDPRFVTWVSNADFGKWSPNGDALDAHLLVDYGDIQMLRVGLNALGAFFRLWASLETSVRLDSLQALLPQGKLSVEAILKEYPALLAAAPNGTVNQNLSVDAMTRAATAYLRFSNFVFNPDRTAGAATRYIDGDLNLFNADRQFAEDGIVGLEDDPYFRDLFSNISASASEGTKSFIADGKTQQGVTSRVSVNLKALKERPAGVRSGSAGQNFVPAFKGNLVSGAVANGSLNGVLPLLDAGSLSKRIAAAEPAITKVLGTREDQSAPVLTFTELPANGSKVLLGPDSGPVRFSGKVQDESGVDGVYLKVGIRGVPVVYSAVLNEGQPEQVAGKTIRSWNWSVDVPFNKSGPCSFSVYAEDQFSQRSAPKTGSFGVVRAVQVSVQPVEGGTVSVVPAIPSSGLVEVGRTLRISARANENFVFSKLEVRVNGNLLSDNVRPKRDLLVTDTTEITPVFLANPFPARAGQWTGTWQQLGADGFVNVTVTKTGSFTLRVVQGRNAFSYAGVMDASGNATITVPSSFYPVEEGGSPATLSIDLSNGIRLKAGSKDSAGPFTDLAKAAPEAVKNLQSKRFNAALQTGASAGYFGFDVTPAGVVLATGMVHLQGGSQGLVAYPQRTVRYSFSTPLVSSSANARPGMNFYSVASPSNISVHGNAFIEVGTLTGSVGTSAVPTSATVPLAPQADVYSTTVPLKGFAYKAPGSQEWALPSSASTPSVTAFASLRPNGIPNKMGTLTFSLGQVPAFVYGESADDRFVKNGTTLRLLSASGAFNGNLVTKGTGAQTARVYSGVVLRAAGSAGTGPVAVGLSADGLLISFE